MEDNQVFGTSARSALQRILVTTKHVEVNRGLEGPCHRHIYRLVHRLQTSPGGWA